MSGTIRLVRRLVVTVVGVLLIILGIILIPLPGPGSVVIIGGLYVLGIEYRKPREWGDRMRRRAREVIDRVTHQS